MDSQQLSRRPDRLNQNTLSSSLGSGSVSRNDNRVVTALSIGLLAEMIMGVGVTFGASTGMITGPETAFRGAIYGEKILPLRVILLVPTILLTSESSFSKFISSVAGQSCLIPW